MNKIVTLTENNFLNIFEIHIQPIASSLNDGSNSVTCDFIALKVINNFQVYLVSPIMQDINLNNAAVYENGEKIIINHHILKNFFNVDDIDFFKNLNIKKFKSDFIKLYNENLIINTLCNKPIFKIFYI